jgi:outer membrane protein TolC
MRVFFTSLSISLSVFLVAHAEDKVSLQESIRIAIEKNPKTLANSRRLDAMLERINAEKYSNLPSLSVYSATGFYANQGSRNDSSFSSKNQNSSLGIAIRMNLFNGFADYYRLQAKECEFKQRESVYNSTNEFIPNTKGQIASLVLRNYINLSDVRENLANQYHILEMLNQLFRATENEKDKNKVDIQIKNTSTRIKELISEEKIASENYRYVVTQAAPKNLFSMKEVIRSIILPELPEEALHTGLQKSPDVMAARFNVECSQLNYKSSKANAYSPKIDFSISKNYSNNRDQIENQVGSSSGAAAVLSLQFNLSPDLPSSLKAQGIEIEAAQTDLDAEIDELKHNIEIIYPELKSLNELNVDYEANLRDIHKSLDDVLAKIESGEHLEIPDFVGYALDLIGNYQNQLFVVRFNYRQIINQKFELQRTIGTLFESLGLMNNETFKSKLIK